MLHSHFRSELAKRISQLAPNDSVRLPNEDDRTTWSIDFRPSATPQQIAAANAELLVFTLPAEDPTDLEDASFPRAYAEILVAAALLAGISPANAKATARLRIKQAKQLLS